MAEWEQVVVLLLQLSACGFLSLTLCNSLINIVFTHNATRSNTPIILIRVSIVKSSRLWGWEATYSRTFFRFFTTEVHVLIQGQASRKHGVSALHCISYSLSLYEGIVLLSYLLTSYKCYNENMTITVTNTQKKTDLLAFTLPQLQDWLVERGEAPFRAKQIYSWLYQYLATDFSAMTNLPQALRQRLAEEATIGPMIVRSELHSKD